MSWRSGYSRFCSEGVQFGISGRKREQLVLLLPGHAWPFLLVCIFRNVLILQNCKFVSLGLALLCDSL